MLESGPMGAVMPSEAGAYWWQPEEACGWW